MARGAWAVVLHKTMDPQLTRLSSMSQEQAICVAATVTRRGCAASSGAAAEATMIPAAAGRLWHLVIAAPRRPGRCRDALDAGRRQAAGSCA